jgi:uncharacterized oligopeptide transporter (OPT) family protein
MTERGRQNTSNVALFSVAVAIIGLTLTILAGIWRLGTMWGAVSTEHQQIFQKLEELHKKCP